MKIEASDSYKTWIQIYQATWHHTPQSLYHCGNLRFHISVVTLLLICINSKLSHALHTLHLTALCTSTWSKTPNFLSVGKDNLINYKLGKERDALWNIWWSGAKLLYLFVAKSHPHINGSGNSKKITFLIPTELTYKTVNAVAAVCVRRD